MANYDTPLIGNAKEIGEYGNLACGIKGEDCIKAFGEAAVKNFAAGMGWLNFIVFKARNGKMYIKPDTYEPKQQDAPPYQEQPTNQAPPMPEPPNHVVQEDDDDLPF